MLHKNPRSSPFLVGVPTFSDENVGLFDVWVNEGKPYDKR